MRIHRKEEESTAVLQDRGLRYFTHMIEGRLYGGWYRVLSGRDLEVLAVGMMEVAEFAGFDAEGTARSVLEEFIRRSERKGRPIPPLDAQPTDGTAARQEFAGTPAAAAHGESH